MAEEKNLSLLRPFDLMAAAAGELVTNRVSEIILQYVGGGRTPGLSCFKCVEGDYANRYIMAAAAFLRMAPLGWVEGKPVYPGDVLYWNTGTGRPGSVFTAGDRSEGKIIGGRSECTSGEIYSNPEDGMFPENLTWTRPKRKVKKSRWVNIYSLNCSVFYLTKEEADASAHQTREACVEVFWEVEE